MPMMLPFPDGFDPRALTDAQVARATQDAFLDYVNNLMDEDREARLTEADAVDFGEFQPPTDQPTLVLKAEELPDFPSRDALWPPPDNG